MEVESTSQRSHSPRPRRLGSIPLMVHQGGVKPPAYRLSGECSFAELQVHEMWRPWRVLTPRPPARQAGVPPLNYKGKAWCVRVGTIHRPPPCHGGVLPI